jgi:hypothetical protein
VAGIYNIENRHVLKIIGNDIEEKEYHIAFNDHVSYGWHIVGTARECMLRETERAVMEALRELGEATAEEVGRFLGKSRQAAYEDLKRLYHERGIIEKKRDWGKKGGGRDLYFIR